MTNLDMVKQKNTEMAAKLQKALAAGDAQAAAGAMGDFQNALAETMQKEFEQYRNVTDMQVLQSRGLRALTTEEQEWYQKFISAVKSGARQEIENLNDVIPPTVVDRVLDDMKKDHPLLNAITFQNAAGAVKLVLNGIQMASKLGSWGKIASAITQEVTGKIEVVDVEAAKYTAYFIIPKDFVKFNSGFAPMWVDRYIRLVLGEVIANGLEKTIISGDGKDQFLGMDRDISTSTGGAYAAKTAVKIADFGTPYANVIADLCKDANDDYRNVTEVLLVVNPKDYVTKIRQIQSTITHAGILDLISHTFPTKVVASAFMEEGKAVVGIAKNYFAGLNGGKSGRVEYSDEYQFLEDNRVYTTRVYGYGRPVDNNSFAVLDISKVSVPAMPVRITETVTTKAES